MKKLLFFFLIVGVILAGGAWYVLANIQQFKPILEEQISSAIQKDVQVGSFKLTWQNGLAVSAQDVTVAQGLNSQKSLVEIESVVTSLQLAPLLNKELKIGSVSLQDFNLHLTRNVNGEWEGFEREPEEPVQESYSQGEASKTGDSASLALSWLVQSLSVDGGTITIVDNMGEIPSPLIIEDISIEVSQLAWDRPIAVEASADVFGVGPNLVLEGEIRIGSDLQSFRLKDAKAELDLDKVHLNELNQLLNTYQSPTLNHLDGDLEVFLEPIRIDEKGVSEVRAEVSLKRGKLATDVLSVPLDSIHLDLTYRPSGVHLKDLSASIGDGRMNFQGKADLTQSTPFFQFTGAFNGLRLEEWVPKDPGQPYQLEGRLFTTVKGSAKGLEEREILESLKAQGQINIQDGVIRNLNVLREILDKVSVIPSLTRKLETGLPEDYEEKLTAKDTHLQPVNIPLYVQNGALGLNPIDIQGDTFRIRGTANVGLIQKNVLAPLTLFIDKGMSQAMERSVHELKYLKDQEGQIGVPIEVKGSLEAIQVVPDLQYVISRLAVEKASQFLRGLTSKGETQTSTAEVDQEVSGDTTTTQESEPSSTPASESTVSPQSPLEQDPVASLVNQFFQVTQTFLEEQTGN